MYADDLQVYISRPLKNMADTINKVNIDLNNIYSWCRENGLRINPEKTVAMCIGTRQIYSKMNLKDYNIILNNVVIN